MAHKVVSQAVIHARNCVKFWSMIVVLRRHFCGENLAKGLSFELKCLETSSGKNVTKLDLEVREAAKWNKVLTFCPAAAFAKTD